MARTPFLVRAALRERHRTRLGLCFLILTLSGSTAEAARVLGAQGTPSTSAAPSAQPETSDRLRDLDDDLADVFEPLVSEEDPTGRTLQQLSIPPSCFNPESWNEESCPNAYPGPSLAPTVRGPPRKQRGPQSEAPSRQRRLGEDPNCLSYFTWYPECGIPQPAPDGSTLAPTGAPRTGRGGTPTPAPTQGVTTELQGKIAAVKARIPSGGAKAEIEASMSNFLTGGNDDALVEFPTYVPDTMSSPDMTAEQRRSARRDAMELALLSIREQGKKSFLTWATDIGLTDKVTRSKVRVYDRAAGKVRLEDLAADTAFYAPLSESGDSVELQVGSADIVVTNNNGGTDYTVTVTDGGASDTFTKTPGQEQVVVSTGKRAVIVIGSVTVDGTQTVTAAPTDAPTDAPTTAVVPTDAPTALVTPMPSAAPTAAPTFALTPADLHTALGESVDIEGMTGDFEQGTVFVHSDTGATTALACVVKDSKLYCHRMTLDGENVSVNAREFELPGMIDTVPSTLVGRMLDTDRGIVCGVSYLKTLHCVPFEFGADDIVLAGDAVTTADNGFSSDHMGMGANGGTATVCGRDNGLRCYTFKFASAGGLELVVGPSMELQSGVNVWYPQVAMPSPGVFVTCYRNYDDSYNGWCSRVEINNAIDGQTHSKWIAQGISHTSMARDSEGRMVVCANVINKHGSACRRVEPDLSYGDLVELPGGYPAQGETKSHGTSVSLTSDGVALLCYEIHATTDGSAGAQCASVYLDKGISGNVVIVVDAGLPTPGQPQPGTRVMSTTVTSSAAVLVYHDIKEAKLRARHVGLPSIDEVQARRARLAVVRGRFADKNDIKTKVEARMSTFLEAAAADAAAADDVVEFEQAVGADISSIADAANQRAARRDVAELALLAIRAQGRRSFVTRATDIGLSTLPSKSKVRVYDKGAGRVRLGDLASDTAFYMPLPEVGDIAELELETATAVVTHLDGGDHKIVVTDGGVTRESVVSPGQTHTLKSRGRRAVLAIGSVSSDGAEVDPDAPLPDPDSTTTVTQEVTFSGLDASTYEGDLRTAFERGYGLAVGVCSGSCDTYADGVQVSSSAETAAASSARRLLSAGSTTVTYSVTVSGTSSAFAVATSGCTGTCTGTTLTSSIGTVATATGVTVPSTLSVSYLGAVSAHASRKCGNGRLEAVPHSGTGMCFGVGSRHDLAGTVQAEACDVSSDAQFGVFDGGCGEKSQCALDATAKPRLEALTSTGGDSKRAKQLLYGMQTKEMLNTAFNPYDAASGSTPRINPCLYSSQLVDANGLVTSDLASAVKCEITDADRTKYTTLANCYDSTSDPNGADFGKRLDDTDPDYQLYGHKCQWPVDISIDRPVGGAMTWTPTPRDSSNKVVAPFDGTYDVCFSLSDPSWPAVHPSSNEFLQQLTRMQFDVVCDPVLNEAAYPDPDGDCEVFGNSTTPGSYEADPEQHSHKCTRLGNRKNPCSQVHRQWELLSCDPSGACESLEGLASEYVPQYGVTQERGVRYSFEHDSADSKNPFRCATKEFNNVNLTAAGYVFGEATEAQSRYICATGGQDTPCAPGMGEIVHRVDTCSAGTQYHDIQALKARVSPSKWKDLSQLYNQVFTDPADVSTATTGSNPVVDCAADPDDADCEVYRFYRDLQQYESGCGRTLKLRVDKGVSGQMMLSVQVRNYNTAVHDADADRGYTYWTAATVPVAITAVVKPPVAGENLGRHASVGTAVNEKESLSFLGGALGGPFDAMATSDGTVVSENSRIGKFSRSTRTHVEFVECTGTHGKIATDLDESVPRFRIAAGGVPGGTLYGGNFGYHAVNFTGDAADRRLYELSTSHSYEAPTVTQLKALRPELTLRAEHDFASHGSWWTGINPGLAGLDSYHEGYSGHDGLCLITRLHVFEPSSCDSVYIDSDPYYIEATPENAAQSLLSTSFNQSQTVWDEDATVPLRIAVNHAGASDDSKMWYFSHVEIEDLNFDGSKDKFGFTEQDGGSFELFSYGSTVGDSVGGHSDGVTNKVGITRASDGKTWRSFANRCTRWIYENGAQNGNTTLQGGFGAPGLDHTGFASAEDCLEDARRQGEELWGQPRGLMSTKNGVFLRPHRKMTKNLHLRVTVYMYDGDAFGWHSGLRTSLEQTASAEIRLLHVPRVTRYDQEEIRQVDQEVDENGVTAVEFSAARTAGVGLPLPYRDGAYVCTYVREGTDGTAAGVDEIDTTAPSHDTECEVNTVATDCPALSGRRVSCEASGADGTRATLETLVIFDESEGAAVTGKTRYQDGSSIWGDQEMAMPENLPYQPAGWNPKAADGMQWYRIEPCDNQLAAESVRFCKNATSPGYDPENANGIYAHGKCDVRGSGQAHDALGTPSQATAALTNSLSIDSSGALLTDNVTMGYSRNFWIVERRDAGTADFLPRGSLCFRGRSDFNTEDGSHGTDSPVNLRLVAVALDSVTGHRSMGPASANLTWSARSKSNTDQGRFSVAVKHVRQLVAPSVLAHAWQAVRTVDGASHSVSFVEERNDASRNHTAAQLTWSDVAGQINASLTADLDCGAGNWSDTFCADRVRFTEQNDFHDQHIGRVEVRGYMQKTCGEHKTVGTATPWLDAGGLFEVYTQYVDDYGQTSKPGHGFDRNGGAGFRVADSHGNCDAVNDPDSDACLTRQILQQEFTANNNGATIVAGQAGGSICSIIFDDGTINATLRASSCHIRDSYNVVGRNTDTWSDTVLNRVVANKCHRPSGGGSAIECPAGPLTAREIASNLRFRLPHRWSNCVRFKFDVTVSNDDRVKPDYHFGGTTLLPDYKSGPVTVYVEPQQRAEEPVMWIGTDLADDSQCLGSTLPSCVGETGVRALGDLAGLYPGIDGTSNLNSAGAMTRITMVAGYRSQVRVLAASGSTDVKAEHDAPVSPLTSEAGYDWDSLRESHDVSGEHVHLTVESKYDAMTNKTAQRFCLWLCPAGTPAGQGCDKNDLVRLRPLPESGADFTQGDVNCDPCTAGDDGCYEHGLKADGTALMCRDQYNRDASLTGCPTYSTATPYHNPGSRYSIKCSKTGKCPELRNLYVQYPAEQIEDDVLEFTAWSRADWRGAAGYQRTRISMNVLMKPSITLSEVGLAVEERDSCDADRAGSHSCPNGFFGAPVQPDQTVTVVANATPPIIVALQESKLHGAEPNTACVGLASDSALAQGGSASAATTDCGIRFPVNFNDNTLMAVAPIGVKFRITAGNNIDAKALAQSLQMLCSAYARSATGAAGSDCVGRFVAVDPNSLGASSEDTTLLRFQSKDASTQPDDGRLIAWGQFEASKHPASHLSWNVGEQMTRKEMVLFGSDSNAYSLDDYSFNNEKCEPDRFFDVELTHQVGYAPSVVAETRAKSTVRVEDDDFYGKVQLAGISTGEKLVPLTTMSSAALSGTMAKTAWNDASDPTKNKPFHVYLIRSRRSSESDSESKRSVGKMKPMRVWIKVDLDTLNENEFEVEVRLTHGKASQYVGDIATLTALEVARGDGITPNMIRVDLPAAEPGTDDADCSEWVTDPTYNNTYFDCSGTVGLPDKDVPFQFVDVIFRSKGSPSLCNTGGDKDIKFSLERVDYLSAAGAALDGKEIDCGDAARSPLSAAEKAVVYTQTLETEDETPSDTAPFRVSFAGFDPSDRSGSEGSKDSPVAWNAGIDGGVVAITETEHSACTQSGTGFSCAPREFKMHLCATLRDVENGTTWSTWNSDTFRFFTEVKDSSNEWSKIGTLYDLHCPSSAELGAVNNLVSGATVNKCVHMSSKVNATGEWSSSAVYCEGAQYEAMSETDKAEYCGPSVPRRLMWEMTTNADAGRDAFVCPTETSQGDTSRWDRLPFVRFTLKDDGDVVNLSRRPKLCIGNGGLPWDIGSSTDSETCSAVPDLGCVDLRIEDDELFAQDNHKLDADSVQMEALFSEPVWDSINGKLNISVDDRYYHAPHERTLVNVGVGACEDREALVDFWGAHAGNTTNPVTDGTTAFGSCDFLDSDKFPQNATNAEMFAALFGETSAQLTAAQYADPTNQLFGFTGSVSAPNRLFPEPRKLGPGGEWTAVRADIDDHGNTELGTSGFRAELSVSLERLQACRDRLGRPVVDIGVSEGNTVYEFSLSSTHVTAMRRGDTSYVHYSPVCTDRKYSLTVSNTMFALAGTATNSQANAIYVDSMRYRSGPDGVCSSHSDCEAAHGPEHECPADPDEYDSTTLKLFEYAVNMDMRTVTDTIGTGQSVTSYYGLSDVAEVVVNENNCYGAAIHSVEALSGKGDYSEVGVSRTRLTFRTPCTELRPKTGGEFGLPVADAFATCKSDPALSTDFGFRVRVWECTNEASLKNPAAANSGCQRLPDWLRVSIAVAFVEDPRDIRYEVEFESQMSMYRGFDHRLPDGSFPSSSARDTWRSSNVLKPTAADPFVTYSVDSMLTASLGFVPNSALEGVMTTAIRQVRLCRFKKFCHLPGLAANPTGSSAPQCSWENLMDNPTHSPMANWARNPTLDGGKGCAEVGTSTGCAVGLPDGVPAPPRLTCNRQRWEDFAVAAAQAYVGTSAESNLRSGISGIDDSKTLSVANLAMALNPTIEAVMLVDHGATTQLAESVYGNCEKSAEVLSVPETIADAADPTQSVELRHIMPKASATGESAGVCTCKGQRAYAFTDTLGANPYRAAGNRKVIYADKYYDSSATDPASLHKCTWLNAPQHSTSKTPLNSVDQFAMSLRLLRRDEEYFFEANAVQFDHQVFSSAGFSGEDQFGLGLDAAPQARRLLSTGVGPAPRAAIAQSARAALRPRPAGRRALSLMVPVSNELTTTATMPQGQATMSEADDSGAMPSGATGGFVVTGEPQSHKVATPDPDREFMEATLLHADDYDFTLSNAMEWIHHGSFDGLAETRVTAQILFDIDGENYNPFMAGYYSAVRVRASVAVSFWVAVILLIVEGAAMAAAAARGRPRRSPFFRRETQDKARDSGEYGQLYYAMETLTYVLGGYPVLAILLWPLGLLVWLPSRFPGNKKATNGMGHWLRRLLQDLLDYPLLGGAIHYRPEGRRCFVPALEWVAVAIARLLILFFTALMFVASLWSAAIMGVLALVLSYNGSGRDVHDLFPWNWVQPDDTKMLAPTMGGVRAAERRAAAARAKFSCAVNDEGPSMYSKGGPASADASSEVQALV